MNAPAPVVARAPGRVNLLGEHTDYNDGFVLPTAIPQHTTVSLRTNGTNRFAAHAAALGETATFDLDHAPAEVFARYVYGCLRELSALGADIPGLDIDIESDVPIGTGLSSSAALEVALMRALRRLLDINIDDVALARLAQSAELRFAGVRCGIMDQMASSLAGPGKMLFLDTRSLERRALPMPADTQVLVLDSGAGSSLAASGCAERRAECEEAARLLGVRSLRDIAGMDSLDALPDPLRKRARHVVTENRRVLDAVDSVGAALFGTLMNASHASLRDDYAVSVPALDTLVALLQAHPSVFGAKLTGAGFGGACVALCRAGEAPAVADAVLRDYARGGFEGRSLVPDA